MLFDSGTDFFQRQHSLRPVIVNFDDVKPELRPENIADLAGLLAAHDAYVLSLKGKTDVVIGGLSGEQRFFLAFAQRWRKSQSEAALRQKITTDPHSPGEYRSDTVRNVEAWYKAYKIAPGDKLYLGPKDRVEIW